jgi:predicted DNA-binding transcriptional regulator YafY
VSRTARLFELLDALRAHRRPVTAAQLAEGLSVSVRTVYRDVQTLIGLGAPIDGGAGLGYVMRTGFFLPPLMFSEEELEALVLGARWVREQADAGLARAAESALSKIATASPRDLRERIAETGLWAPRRGADAGGGAALGALREAIRRERKLRFRYVDATGAASERQVWPIALAFFEGVRVLAAWCELRGDFRHFRADRIGQLEPLSEPYPRPRRELVTQWRTQLRQRAPRGPEGC